MDFFEQQERAHRRTRGLLGYFLLAVAGVIASVYLVVLTFNGWFSAEARTHGSSYGRQLTEWKWWRPELFLGTAGITASIIFLGSGYKTMQLSAGGSVVAKDLGGRRLDPHSRDFDEKKLLNVVEEMAIASGVPVPEVYLLENEDSINAFAAGRTPSDAVIGVTRGCMKLLNRDELQGVIAHEFSHILNGDMRLNLRLLGLVFGILVIAIMGRVLLRVGAEGRKNGAPILFLGLALWIIGSIGVLFGKLIQAAVSRQREFLADASAVQFTRNPDSIGGALKKIGGLSYGSRLRSPRAAEASHMFFANGLRGGLTSMFATHPPLDERIRKIDRYWDGKYPKVEMPKISAGWRAPEGVGEVEPPRGGIPPIPHHRAVAGLAAAEALDGMGRLSGEQVAEGRLIHQEFPEQWIEAVHHQSGAQALIFALLLAQDDDLRAHELEYLEQATDFVTYGETLRLHHEMGDLHSSRKLALIDMAIPTLRRLPRGEYERFLGIMRRMIESDRQINLFEFTLQRIVQRHLDRYFLRVPPPRIQYRHLDGLQDEVSILLSTLALLGHSGEAGEAQHAFDQGAAEIESSLRQESNLELRDAGEASLELIETALDRFDRATPLIKKRLLYACGKTVMADGVIESDEAELLRAIADTIGCPVPPFVKGQKAEPSLAH